MQEPSEDILRVSLADKVHNARAILRDLRKADVGEKVWERFNQPKDRQLWYYRSLAEVFCRKHPDQLSNELREIVELLDADVKSLKPRAVRKRHSKAGVNAKHPL
jgi:hypothetical protein